MSMHPIPPKIHDTVMSYVPENEGYEVFLFGSRAKGDYHAHSDYDIGIRGKKPFPRKSFLKMQSELRELPYLIDVIDFYHTDTPFQKIAYQHIQPWNSKEYKIK